MLRPVLDLLLDTARPAPADRLLDVGCGTGASTIAAAERVTEGAIVGVDISSPLLNRARSRAEEAGLGQITFLLADAQTHPFQPASFDLAISRFGVMFFDNPVAAFRNLARALRPGGRLTFAAWAELARNPWFQLPRDVAVARLGPASITDPTAPGPFAFQDSARVCALMAEAGLADVRAETADVGLTVPGGIDGAAELACRVGPAARILKEHEASASDAAAMAAEIGEAFRRFEDGGDVRFPALVHLFSATGDGSG